MTARRRATGLCAALVAAVGMSVLVAPAALAAPSPSKHSFDPLELPDVATIKAKARSAERPRFVWPALADATEYALVVQNLKGRPYWAWRGPDTSVYLGGVDKPSADAVGPRLTKPAQYQVVAYAADGSIVGASKWRIVEPR